MNQARSPSQVDSLQWLEDPASRSVQAWTAQHEAAFLAARAGWRSRPAVGRELERVSVAQGAIEAPRPAGSRLFAARLESGAEHQRLIVIEADGRVRTLLDPMLLDPTGATTLERWDCAPDGNRVIYQLASGGTEDASLFVLDVDTGHTIDGPIDRVRRSSIGWLADGSGFYYVRRLPVALRPDANGLHRRVYLHRIGADPASDQLIFGEGRGGTQFYAVQTSADGRWLTLTATSGAAPHCDVWIADLSASPIDRPDLQPVQVGVDARTSVVIRAGSDAALLKTNLHADRGRLATVSLTASTRSDWLDLISEDPVAILDDVVVLDGPELTGPLLLVHRTRHAVSQLTVYERDTGALVADLDLPPCSKVGPLRVAPFGAHEAYLVVSGFTLPGVVYRFDARVGSLVPWQFPDGHRGTTRPASDVAVEQLSYLSADGTTVRMFLLTRPGAVGPRPTLLTGYGGFGQSFGPGYLPEALTWVRAGGAYAVANIRGGGEEGQRWHRAGIRELKLNGIADFEAAADRLVELGYTTPRQLGIYGASNGGLLAGAALTRRPRSYGAVACIAPLLDMLRYQQSGMGASWVEEYGDAGDPGQRPWLQAYSPYQQIRDGVAYPPVLFAVFDGDSRVDPWHARKMCAALEHASSSDAPLLYRLERGTGHGMRAASRRVELFSDLLSFFADHLGLTFPARPPDTYLSRNWLIPVVNRSSLASTPEVGNSSAPCDRRTAMSKENDEVIAHRATDEAPSQNCGIQLGLTDDEVVAHSAADEEDVPGCQIQYNS